MIMYMHFVMMTPKTGSINLCSRNLWSIMRYMMNLNLIMNLIYLSSKHDGVSS